VVAVRVTAVRRRRAGDPAVDVVLDSGESVRVHDRRIGEHRLTPGADLAGPGLDALRRAAAFDEAERRALRLLERRPRSAGELRARMEAWGVDEVTAAGVVERLGELGQVDDRRLAAAVAESRRAPAWPSTTQPPSRRSRRCPATSATTPSGRSGAGSVRRHTTIAPRAGRPDSWRGGASTPRLWRPWSGASIPTDL